MPSAYPARRRVPLKAVVAAEEQERPGDSGHDFAAEAGVVDEADADESGEALPDEELLREQVVVEAQRRWCC